MAFIKLKENTQIALPAELREKAKLEVGDSWRSRSKEKDYLCFDRELAQALRKSTKARPKATRLFSAVPAKRCQILEGVLGSFFQRPVALKPSAGACLAP